MGRKVFDLPLARLRFRAFFSLSKVVGLSLFFCSSCSQLQIRDDNSAQVERIIKAIPEDDRRLLESFFQEVVYQENFGFTLFGDKAISVTGFFDPLPFENYLQIKRNRILKEGWEIWKKYHRKFPVENYLFTEEIYQDLHVITIVNKKAFIKTVQGHRGIFQKILGEEISPEILLKKVEAPGANVFELLHQHEGIYGILLGYGVTNSMLYQRRAELNVYNSHPTFTLSRISPSKGFLTTEEEAVFLKNEIVGIEHHSLPYLIHLPQFVGLKEHPETKQLQKNYRKLRAHIAQSYAGQDFLRQTLLQLCA